MGEAKQKEKLSRHATDEEIFPEFTHAPVQRRLVQEMTMVLDGLRKAFPDYDVTLFLAERKPSMPGLMPRFNYMSSAERADMIAVLRAFVAKNSAHADVIDKIKDEPPTREVQ